MDDIIIVPPLTTQMVLRKFAMYSSSYLGNDLYYLNEGVQILINHIKTAKGEGFIREHIVDWDKKKMHLIALNNLLQEVKAFYDALDDKKFKDSEKPEIIRRYFLETASRVSVMQPLLYELWEFAVMHTQIHRQTIPAEYFKIIEHSGMKKMHLKSDGSVAKIG